MTVLIGDCEKHMMGMESSSIDCIITSPPYNLNIKYSGYNDTLNPLKYQWWIREVFREVHKVLKPEGHLFLQLGGINRDPLLPHRILNKSILEDGIWQLQNEIIWVKSISMGQECKGHIKPINSKRYVNMAHEYVFHITKTGDVPIDRLAVGVPYADKSNLKRFGTEGRPDKRCAGNVWFCPYDTIKSRDIDRAGHPATYPVTLVERCIKLAGLKPGDKVLDPFLGTGTTLVACRNLGIEGIGIELVPEVAEAARRRLNVCE